MNRLASIDDRNDRGAKSPTPGKSWKFIYPTESDPPLAIRQDPPTSFVFVAKRIC
jgi:hypothetical protein